jgi:hypothetical protein
MIVKTLVAMEVFYLFSVGYRHGGSLTWQGARGTPAVLGAVALVALKQVVFAYLPIVQSLFGTVSLAPWRLAQCAAPGGRCWSFWKLTTTQSEAGSGSPKTQDNTRPATS